jgi:16S rRNA (uracil1498-N3)-methyltransferase
MHFALSTEAVSGATIEFDPDESRHLVQVLRMKVGDELRVLDGNGHLYAATISLADKRHCSALVGDLLEKRENVNLCHLMVAPTKNINRLEWMLEKATEMGLRSLQLMETQHTERSKVRLDRLERIAQSAVKQSVAFFLPDLRELKPFEQCLHSAEGENYIAVVKDGLPLLRDEIGKGKEVTILIGPEGDFSEGEVEQAEAAGFKPVSLGEKRLRVETAALAACFTINLVNQ